MRSTQATCKDGSSSMCAPSREALLVLPGIRFIGAHGHLRNLNRRFRWDDIETHQRAERAHTGQQGGDIIADAINTLYVRTHCRIRRRKFALKRLNISLKPCTLDGFTAQVERRPAQGQHEQCDHN